MPRAAIAAVLAAALAAPALAQSVPSAPPPPPSASPSPPALPSPAAQSDRLRQALNLRPDQETALQAFVAAMQPRPGEFERIRAEVRREASLPTPQRLDAIEARMKQMQAEALARIAATRAFYAQLTPAQQNAFDHIPQPGR